MTEALTYKRKTEWLGNYPSHWDIKRIKNIFFEVDERSVSGDEELLSVSQYTGITPKRDSLENEDDYITNAESLEGYKKVKIGDLVINIMLAWNGCLGISPYNGIVSPAYCVYRCLPGNNPEYFGYLFSTAFFKAEFRRNSTGIIDSRLRLYSDKFFSIFSVVPTLEEQNTIVDYINVQNEKIDSFIKSKLHFIEFLGEQKGSIINEFCLKGINKKSFKKVNDDRFQEIPDDWEFKRLKYIIKEKNVRSINGEEELLSLSKYRGVIPQKSIEERAGLAESLIGYKIVGINDLVLNRMQAVNGLVGVSKIYGITSPDYSIFEPCNNNVFMEYLGYLFKTTGALSHFYSRAKGVMAGYIRLYTNELFDIKIPFPTINEQMQIVHHIKEETRIIDTTIGQAEREIELIREYKEAMIAEAVMGKMIAIKELK